MNNKISRTVEKVLAWIANIIIVLYTGMLAIVLSTGALTNLKEIHGLKEELSRELSMDPNFKAQNIQVDNAFMDEIFMYIELGLKFYVWILVGLLVIALIASFTMRKRILSGSLFILLAVLTFIFSAGVGFIVYLPYLIVAIMLFVRKDPKNNDNFSSNNDEIEKIEYV